MAEQQQQKRQAAAQAAHQQQQPAQQPAAVDLATLLQTMSTQKVSLSSVVQGQSVSSIVPRYDGWPTKFKSWIKAINKYRIITQRDDGKLKLLALQMADGPLSDYVHRWLSTHQDYPWVDLCTELQSLFASR